MKSESLGGIDQSWDNQDCKTLKHVWWPTFQLEYSKSIFIPKSDFAKICPEKGKPWGNNYTIYAKQPLQVNLHANHPSGLMLKQTFRPINKPTWQSDMEKTWLGGGNSFFCRIFNTRSLWKWSNLTIYYISNGLKPPTRKWLINLPSSF